MVRDHRSEAGADAQSGPFAPAGAWSCTGARADAGGEGQAFLAERPVSADVELQLRYLGELVKSNENIARHLVLGERQALALERIAAMLERPIDLQLCERQ